MHHATVGAGAVEGNLLSLSMLGMGALFLSCPVWMAQGPQLMDTADPAHQNSKQSALGLLNACHMSSVKVAASGTSAKDLILAVAVSSSAPTQ